MQGRWVVGEALKSFPQQRVPEVALADLDSRITWITLEVMNVSRIPDTLPGAPRVQGARRAADWPTRLSLLLASASAAGHSAHNQASTSGTRQAPTKLWGGARGLQIKEVPALL